MSQLCVHLGLMVLLAGFAFLTSVSCTAALAAAGGAVLVAGAASRVNALPRLGLLVIVALVPLSFFGTLVSAGGMNSLTKLIFLPALGLLALQGILFDRGWVFGREGLFALLFALSLVLSRLLNDSTPLSGWFLFRFAGLLLLFLLTANAVRTKRDVALLFIVVVASCLLSVAGSVMAPVHAAPNAYWNGAARMTGWAAEDAPTFGTNLLIALLISAYFGLTSRKAPVRLALLAVSGLLALAILQTFARGITLVLVLSLGYMLFRLRNRVSIPRTLVFLTLLGLCLAWLAPAAFYERMAGVADGTDDATIHRRLASTLIGAKLLAQQPLLGYGPGSFPFLYMGQDFRFLRAGTASLCFNLYLSVGSQAGLLGLASMGGLLGAAFLSLRSVRRAGQAGEDKADRHDFLAQAAEVTEIALVALLLISVFEPTDMQKYLWIFLGLSAALASIRRNPHPPARRDDPDDAS